MYVYIAQLKNFMPKQKQATVFTWATQNNPMVFPVISPFSHIYSLTVDGKHADHVSCALHHELASKSIFNLESNKIEVFKFFLLLGMSQH